MLVGIIFFLMCCEYGAGVPLFIAFILMLIAIFLIKIGVGSVTESRNQDKADMRRYEEQCKRYKELEDADIKRVEYERSLIPQLNKDIEALKDEYEKIWDLSDQYYNLNVIHKAYRDLAPMAMFAQYLNTGRCTTLEGHEGCYNLYEYEKRQDLIITKLDIALEKLDQLREGQFELQAALIESNNNITKLTQHVAQTNSSLNTLKEHQEVQAYQMEQAARNTKLLADYTIVRDLWNGV